MHLKLYLIYTWVSGSLCALIEQKELGASKAASASVNPASWGFDLTLGPQEYSKQLTTSVQSATNDAPNANSFHEVLIGGQTSKEDGLDLGLTLRRNGATYSAGVEKDDTVIRNHDSKKRKMLPETYSQSYPVKRPTAQKAKEYEFGTYQKLLTPHQQDEQILRSMQYQKSFFNKEIERTRQDRPQVLSSVAQRYNDLITLLSQDGLQFNQNRNSGFKDFNRGIYFSMPSQKTYEGSHSLEPTQQKATSGINGKNWGERPGAASINAKGKGKMLNAFTKTNSFENRMQEYGMTEILNRNTEIDKPGSLESKRSKTPVEEKESAPNSLTQAHTESQWPVPSYDLDRLSNYKDLRYKHWFRHNIVFKSQYERSTLTFIIRELLGREIICKISIPKTEAYQHPLKLTDLRTSYQSQTKRALVSFIDVMNSVSDPPLYPNLEKLQEVQRNAVSFAESLWREFKMEENDRLKKVSAGHINFFSPGDILQIKNFITDRRFSFRESNRLNSHIFMMWMRRYHKDIYDGIHSVQKPMRLKLWIHSILEDKLLSSIPIKEIRAKILKGVDELGLDFLPNYRTFICDAVNPFMIKWK